MIVNGCPDCRKLTSGNCGRHCQPWVQSWMGGQNLGIWPLPSIQDTPYVSNEIEQLRVFVSRLQQRVAHLEDFIRRISQDHKEFLDETEEAEKT